jgi:thioredoxin-like negative regulator of GroEL
MSLFLKRGLLCVAAVVACVLVVQAADPPAGGVQWQTNLQIAHRLSRESNKPMLFVFGADWCTWCKKLEKTTLSDRELVAYINANFIPIHIDADRDPRVVEILEAEALPCAVVLSPNADLLGRIQGFRDAAGYKSALATTKQTSATIVPAAAVRR